MRISWGRKFAEIYELTEFMYAQREHGYEK
jgi:hypothetical protein